MKLAYLRTPSIELLHRGSSRQFVDSLIYEIHKHSVLNHPYLLGLSEGAFDNMDDVIRDYAYQYSFYSLCFTRYLEGVIKALPDEAHKIALQENLLEEQGDPSSKSLEERPHVEIFQHFKTEIGINSSYLASHKPSTTTILWRDLFLQKCNSDVVGVGLGAIGLATEFIVPSIYRHIALAIENHSSFPASKSLFFRLHIDCDEDHAQNLIDVTIDVANNIETREAIRFGVISALNLRNSFWDSQFSRIPTIN